MDESGKGRGRGYLILQACKKASSSSSSSPPESSGQPTPGASTSASMVSPPPAIGGRGRMAAMMLAQRQSSPAPSVIVPASDVSPTLPVQPKGMGRGINILKSLRAAQSSSSDDSESKKMAQLEQKMAQSTVSEISPSVVSGLTMASVPRNKHLKEIKDTPPVVKLGESGKPCNVTANYIYLKFQENCVFEYGVAYDPDQDHKNLRFKLLNEHRHYFKEKIFDGTTMYVPHELPEEALNLVSTNPFDQSKVQISITFRRRRRLSEMIHIYNVIFKHIMNDLELVRFGRQHFSQQNAVQIPQYKLEVWPGFVTAVDEFEGGLMLTMDSTHRVLRTQSVLSVIKECFHTDGANWKKRLSDIIIGCSVMTTYNKKLFRVDAIDDSLTPKSTFEKKINGESVQISYVDYYKQNYGIDIMDWNQPLLISRQTKHMPGVQKPTEFLLCLVPELCQMTGLTDDMRANFRLMKDVAVYTRVTPNQRHAAFKKYIQNVMNNETARGRLAGWGLSLAPETVDLTARVLQPEVISFGNGVKVPGKPTAEWNAEATRNAVMQAVDIKRWAVLFTEKDRRTTKEFVDTVKRCSGPMGISVAEPDLVPLPNDRTDAYVAALKQCLAAAPQLVVAICPTSRDDRYAAIKKLCCVDSPVPSQVVNARTIMNSQKLRAVTQKILLQMNCKLGGTLWHIHIPFKSAMVIGIDAYHEASRKRRSVCAFVASYTDTMTHWYSRVAFQESGQEIADKLKTCLVDSLRHYMKHNGRLPDRIVIFRDGVGDGQFKTIQQYEIPQLKHSFNDFNTMERFNPTLTYVIVQKRINTRVFSKAGKDLENPLPGTVVDHTITRRDWYDYLIISQKVGQGTVTPTHYVVLHDDSGMKPDQCQRLTYKLCHLYYNWPGTVRVPAPCQYAHKLAYLVGQNINNEPAEKLCDKLFFL